MMNLETQGGLDAKRRSAAYASAGFTLTELAVVITVTALLSVLLFPALARGRSSAQGVGCLGNLRQWGLATQLFAADHGGLLPRDGAPNGTWTHDAWYAELPRVLGLAPYHELAWRTNIHAPVEPTLWLCPANSRRSDGRSLFHYCLNRHVNGSGPLSRAILLESVPQPSLTVWLFDNGKLAASAGENNVHTNLHRAGAHFLFLDGHVARLGNQEYWDFRRHRGRRDNSQLIWRLTSGTP